MVGCGRGLIAHGRWAVESSLTDVLGIDWMRFVVISRYGHRNDQWLLVGDVISGLGSGCCKGAIS